MLEKSFINISGVAPAVTDRAKRTSRLVKPPRVTLMAAPCFTFMDTHKYNIMGSPGSH